MFLRQQIQEVRDAMAVNVEGVLERQVLLENLVTSTAETE
jgi:Synaptobrevin